MARPAQGLNAIRCNRAERGPISEGWHPVVVPIATVTLTLGPMVDAEEHRGREPRVWLPTLACPTAGVRAAMFAAAVLSVVAGLLGMHALSTGHATHALSAGGAHHSDGHVHTGDHHDETYSSAQADGGTSDTAVMAAVPAPGLAGEGRAEAGLRLVAPVGLLVAASAVGDGTMAGPVEEHDEQAGHGLCPGAEPGHCPAVPTLMSICQAVLTGAGVGLLLLLMLAQLVRGPAWVKAWPTAMTPSGDDRWYRRLYRLRLNNPSLHELCISRT